MYLVTIGEGEAYWEKFGHNAIWFSDPANGIDVVFNWGTFDFRAPDFLRRQIIGDPMYWVEAARAADFLASYQQYDRTITVQRLRLDSAQVRKAYDYARWNAREENKFYRYDYFRDNCSTRVRDLIDLALSGALKVIATRSQTGRSYRDETLRLVDDLAVTQFGIDVALAQPADAEITLWEDMFIPSRVQEAVRKVTLVNKRTRASESLVAEERVLYRSRGHQERETVPRLWAPYLLIGLLLAAELFAVGWAGHRSAAAETIFRVEVAIWALATGILGLVLLLGWLITQHTFWYRNENLFFVNPLAIWLAVLTALSIWRPRWTRPAAIIAATIAMLTALALVLKVIPAFDQDNIPLILLFLPPHMAIAYGLRRRA